MGMVTMARDSYLLRGTAPCAPLQQAPCRGCDRRGSGREVAMAVTLMVLAAGLLSLAGLVFYLNVELNAVRAYLADHETRLGVVDHKLTRLNVYEQLRAYENAPEAMPQEEDDFDEEEDEDDTGPTYPDDDDSGLIETRVPADRDAARVVPPLEPAGSLLRGASTPAAPAEDGAEDGAEDAAEDGVEDEPPSSFPPGLARKRREARQPQLRLYHTLQTPGPGAESWSAYGSRQPQPMYAERPPTGFVTPPRSAATTASYRGTTPAPPVASRRSRVMDAATTVPHAQRHRAGRRQRLQELQAPLQAPPLLQEVPQDVSQYPRSVEVGRLYHPYRQPAPTWTPPRHHRGHWRDPAPGRGVRSIDATVEVEQTWRPYAPVVEGPAIAAHFVGDTARHRASHHYDDNGRLKHPTGEYADWRASDWVHDLGLDRHFRLAEADGHVTVDTPGLYLVYAQVNYANDKDENGYWVYRNGRRELLCAVTTAVSRAEPHANTCFTAGVLQLARGDRVHLRDLAGDRYRVLDHPGRSFLGLVNLSSCKLKQEPPGRVSA